MLKRGHEAEKEGLIDEKREHKLYVGNLDHRVTEYHVIKMFSPFGKIRSEEYMWHTHGPKRGEPRGFAFVEYSSREEAEKAKGNMNGRMAFGRPLVVRFVEEKLTVVKQGSSDPSTPVPPFQPVAASKSAKIAAIEMKLKLMEQEEIFQIEVNPRKAAKLFQPSQNRQVRVGSSERPADPLNGRA